MNIGFEGSIEAFADNFRVKILEMETHYVRNL